jgi:putative methionine-R-sulfoxide reductase with GAF domain
VTDSELSRLDEQELMVELLARTKDILQADTAAVLLLDFTSGQLVATAAAGLEEEVRQGVRIPVGRGFAGRIAAEHRPVILDRVDQTTVLNPILLDKGIRSMMGVPMVTGGRVIGVMHVGSLTGRQFNAEDAQLLQLAADRAAMAVQSMNLRTDRLAAAGETSDPAEVLARLDRKMQHFEPDALATVLYAVFEPGLEQVHFSSAGHLPPVVAYPGRPAELAELPADLMIGVASRPARHVTTEKMPPGTLLCLYTDGLVERHDYPLDEGFDRLCRALVPTAPEVACSAVMGALIGNEQAQDDVALLILRRQPSRSGGAATLSSSASAAGSPRAREW